MPHDPERAPLIQTSTEGREQTSEFSPKLSSPGARIVGFVRGDGEPSWLRSFSWLSFGSFFFNVFLAFVPLSFVAQNKNWDVLYRFGFSFLAIVPLAKLLGDASNQMTRKMGKTLAGFTNLTSGSVIDIIIGLAALLQDDIRIVQTAARAQLSQKMHTIGSRLITDAGFAPVGNCARYGDFFPHAFKRQEGPFYGNGTQHLSSLMTLACFTLAIPAAFESAPETINESDRYGAISKGASIILLLVYCSYLYFQLMDMNSIYGGFGVPTPEAEQAALEEAQARDQNMNGLSAVFALLLIIPVTWFCAVHLISSIHEFSQHYNVSKSFIGLMLLPIITNAAENVPSIYMALTHPLETAVPICVGGTIQIAALVIPLLVVIGWITGHELTLIFGHFETIVLVVSVLLVNTLVQDGKSNYMEGLMLISLYFVIGLTFWVTE